VSLLHYTSKSQNSELSTNDYDTFHRAAQAALMKMGG
jgi:hypothetical protein